MPLGSSKLRFPTLAPIPLASPPQDQSTFFHAPVTQVGPPKVITKRDEATGERLEPMEEAVIEVPEEHVGQVVDLMGQRKAQMLDMSAGSEGATRLKYEVPTRALLGLRSAMLTATKGTAVLNTNLIGYTPYVGDIQTRENGSLVCHETGQVCACVGRGANRHLHAPWTGNLLCQSARFQLPSPPHRPCRSLPMLLSRRSSVAACLSSPVTRCTRARLWAFTSATAT